MCVIAFPPSCRAPPEDMFGHEHYYCRLGGELLRRATAAFLRMCVLARPRSIFYLQDAMIMCVCCLPQLCCGCGVPLSVHVWAHQGGAEVKKEWKVNTQAVLTVSFFETKRLRCANGPIYVLCPPTCTVVRYINMNLFPAVSANA